MIAKFGPIALVVLLAAGLGWLLAGPVGVIGAAVVVFALPLLVSRAAMAAATSVERRLRDATRR